jgi:hypothetical protein
MAGTSTKIGKKRIGIQILIREYGCKKKYAPNTPAIAPDAPTTGVANCGLNNHCVTVAINPHNK